MTSSDPRLDGIVSFERSALIVRYAAWAVLLGMFFAGVVDGRPKNAFLASAVVLIHNAIVHGVLWARVHGFFRTRVNFAVHLAEVSAVVYLTGREESVLFVLYPFLLMGYAVYLPTFRRLVLASAACLTCYGLIIAAEWWHKGIRIDVGIILVRVMSIPATAWFLGSLGELLRNAARDAQVRTQALAASEATLRTILDTAADPIFVYNEQEHITEVNTRACEFLGTSRNQLLGSRLRSFMFDDGLLEQRLGQVRECGHYRGELIFLDAAGQERTVDFHVRSFIRDEERFFVVVAPDITEGKELQEAARLANLDMARLNRELQQVDEMKTELISTVSRRIQSPLCAVMGYVELLLAGELGPTTADQRKALLASRKAAQRVFRTLNETFDVVNAGWAASHGTPEEISPPQQNP